MNRKATPFRYIGSALLLARNEIRKLVKILQNLMELQRIRKTPYETKVFPFVNHVSVVSLDDATPRTNWLNKYISNYINKEETRKYFKKLYGTEVKRFFHQPIGVKGFEIVCEGVTYQRQNDLKLVEKEKTVLELASHCNAKSVLDLGGCEGYYAILFERRGCTVTAVEGTDYHFENAYIVRKNLNAKYRLIQADIENDKLWSFLNGAHFDLTLLLDTIEHCEEPLRLLRRIRNVSKYVLIVTPDEKKCRKRLIRTLVDHSWQFNLDGLVHILNLSGFELREVRKKVGKLFVLASTKEIL